MVKTASLSNEKVIMTVKLCVLIDPIYVLIIILNPIHSLFQFFVLNVFFFLSFHLRGLPTFKCLKKECMEIEYNVFVYKHIPCSFFGCFVCSYINTKKYIQINTLGHSNIFKV